MYKKFLQITAKILKINQDTLDTSSYGVELPTRASKLTSGANGYNTECETTYKVFVK